jgi:hypothetical protein
MLKNVLPWLIFSIYFLATNGNNAAPFWQYQCNYSINYSISLPFFSFLANAPHPPTSEHISCKLPPYNPSSDTPATFHSATFLPLVAFHASSVPSPSEQTDPCTPDTPDQLKPPSQ